MAATITFTDEERHRQGEAIKKLFRLRDVDNVLADWSIESVSPDHARVQITLVEHVSTEDAEALINGRPLGTRALSRSERAEVRRFGLHEPEGA